MLGQGQLPDTAGPCAAASCPHANSNEADEVSSAAGWGVKGPHSVVQSRPAGESASILLKRSINGLSWKMGLIKAALPSGIKAPSLV